jgi:putative nucleotidyltransferase with HDIG domain
MVFSLSEEERYLFNLIGSVAESLGYPAYLVGGYVRDRLLARPCKDIDVVCVGSGIRLAEEVAAQLHPIPRVAVFKRFGTAMLRYKTWEVEFVGARKESYRQDSRKPSVEEGSLEDDLHRRDFTINAMAISLNEKDFGSLLDPFNGLKDMEDRIIRTPLEPGKTFSDDPLRMLRGIRFATQLNFSIEALTYAAMGQHHKRLQIISKERISIELNKIILASQPSIGFKMLFETGLLGQFFPEMVQLHGVETMNGRAHKDNFFHTLQVLDNLSRYSDKLWLRWAAILHDIAKPATKRFDAEAGWTFHGHDAVGANMVPKIFRRLKLPLDHQMKYVQKLVALHLRPISLTKENITDSAVRRLLFDAGEDLDDLMQLCRADITSKNREKVKRYLENYELVMERLKAIEEEDHIRNWQPPVSGELIMETFGIPPSKEVGMIKNAIKDAILDGDIPNTFDAAFHFMLEKGAMIGLSSKKSH